MAMLGTQIRGHIQHYMWGKPQSTSLIADLMKQTDASKPYAELWLGTHERGPATIKDSDQTLLSLIDGNSESWLGKEKIIPFLLKVLSVNNALSIQVHPTKDMAEKLHKSNPEMYDDNHKPEIALPLGHFEALIAFRPLADVCKFVDTIPELSDICGTKRELRDMYGHLMRTEESVVRAKIESLVQRIREREASGALLAMEDELVLRLNGEFPGDIGILSVYFLNHVVVDKPHQFIYCAPNVPHCYLKGECIECMALSDNVVRAGLTPKFKDVELLLSMIRYEDDLLPELVNDGHEIEPGIYLYDPPVRDFKVYEVTKPYKGEFEHASIIICLKDAEIALRKQGRLEKYPLERGCTLFCSAGQEVEILSEETHVFIATH